jgi:hypothetical protein
MEENLHVENRVDGHARLAHVARHALVVGVVAAMRRQVECHRESPLPRRQVAPVKRIRLLRRRKPRILPDGPRARRIHRGVRPAQIRWNSRCVFQMFESIEIRARIKTLQRDVLGRKPRIGFVSSRLRRSRFPIDLCEIWPHLCSQLAETMGCPTSRF